MSDEPPIAEVIRLVAHEAELADRVERLEAAVSRVQELAEKLAASTSWDGKPVVFEQAIGRDFLQALDGSDG